MTDIGLDRIDRAIVNAYQGGFPVVECPFEPASAMLREYRIEIEADELIARIRELVETDTLSRFGASINANAFGGETTLVAMSVPEDRFDAVATTVNAHREVAHNYERDHELNMWFVISVVDSARIRNVIRAIEHETGLDTYRLPKRTEFELGARFPVTGPLSNTDIDLSNLGEGVRKVAQVGAQERELLIAVQDGFPLTATPYGTLANELNVSTDWILRTIRGFLEDGTFRRIGAIPNHYALGYTENPMTVWDIPDSHVEPAGRAVGSLDFVTHCYERPRHGDIWPYNLFAMAHGQSTDEAEERADRIRETIEEYCEGVDGEILTSKQILKKTGLRLTERAANTGSG